MRVLKWAGYAVAGLVVFVLFAGAGALAASEVMIRWPAKADGVQLAAATDPGAVERGRRVAKLNGCHDCHGDRMEGRLFHDEMPIVRAWGPNLTLIAAKDSDRQLERAIRHGVGADGRPLWIMPSYAFSQLSDHETADLIAYVRSFPVTGVRQPAIQIGPVGRLGVLLRKFESEPATIAHKGPVRLDDVGPQYAKGRDLARLCVECHGGDLKGGGFLKTPDLMVAASYEPEDFKTLLHEGVGAGGRKDLGLMTGVAKGRFHALTDAEVEALHGYLKARAGRIIAAQDAASHRTTATLPKS